MKERPIIFTAESVRAILADRKTNTRRVIKFPMYSDITRQLIEHQAMKTCYPMPLGGWVFWDSEPSDQLREFSDKVYATSHDGLRCPHGEPGDRLWVRESFSPHYFGHKQPGYKANWTRVTAEYVTEPKWTSPLYMPRWASRLTLEITGVRVERLQDISERDCLCEGIDPRGSPPPWDESMARLLFREHWDKLNAKRGYPWESNPFVWVLEFIKKEGETND